MWLQKLPAHKRSLPDLIISADALLSDAQILIDDHSQDSHQMAVTGRPVLFWTKKPTTGLSLTSQLRQMKNPSLVLKQLRNKEASLAANAAAPVARPESPPTRPISSNQYTISSGSTLNADLIPSSFAGLIAQTGSNHFQPFSPITNSPIMSAIGSPLPSGPPPMVSPYMPTALPPPPPLISNPTINPMYNHSYQTTPTNGTQSVHTYIKSTDQLNDHNMNLVEKKPPLNVAISDHNNHNLNKSFTTTATQSQ
ncbi:unnamed protein product, partial [Medioppia subpectinata]